MRFFNAVQRHGWDGTFRLLGVVIVGMMAAAAWILRSPGSRTNRIRGALLAAFAPFVFIWPARPTAAQAVPPGDSFPIRDAAHRSHDRASSGSLHELERLRRAGAI